MMRILHFRVAGVTFEGRQSVLARLRGNEPIRLEPEPTNAYDKNAIAVKVALDDGVYHCGYVPCEIAAQVAPLMEGEPFMCEIEDISGGFELSNGDTAAYGLKLKVELPE